MYIAIEGIDTSGKTTQIELLKSQYSDAIFTKEPGATPNGQIFRDMVLNGKTHSKATELFLFLADRAEHIELVIKPNMAQKLIVSDRSLISGMAYAKGFTNEALAIMNKIAVDGIFPDKIIFLKLSKEELETRLKTKAHDHIESRGLEFLLDIQERLIKAANILDIHYHTIDATLPIEAINLQIRKLIDG